MCGNSRCLAGWQIPCWSLHQPRPSTWRGVSFWYIHASSWGFGCMCQCQQSHHWILWAPYPGRRKRQSTSSCAVHDLWELWLASVPPSVTTVWTLFVFLDPEDTQVIHPHTWACQGDWDLLSVLPNSVHRCALSSFFVHHWESWAQIWRPSAWVPTSFSPTCVQWWPKRPPSEQLSWGSHACLPPQQLGQLGFSPEWFGCMVDRCRFDLSLGSSHHLPWTLSANVWLLVCSLPPHHTHWKGVSSTGRVWDLQPQEIWGSVFGPKVAACCWRTVKTKLTWKASPTLKRKWSCVAVCTAWPHFRPLFERDRAIFERWSTSQQKE